MIEKGVTTTRDDSTRGLGCLDVAVYTCLPLVIVQVDVAHVATSPPSPSPLTMIMWRHVASCGVVGNSVMIGSRVVGRVNM